MGKDYSHYTKMGHNLYNLYKNVNSARIVPGLHTSFVISEHAWVL